MWAKKLFTSHDRFNVHKVLGVGCLLHFVCRFAFVGERDMLFGPDKFTTASICWHLCLSCSSLLFRIPQKRVMAKGTEGSMIWPEFRFHSIIFACRSLACIGGVPRLAGIFKRLGSLRMRSTEVAKLTTLPSTGMREYPASPTQKRSMPKHTSCA